MKILTIANIKGGVGKSTIAANLAVAAVLDGLSVILVDADPQASSMAFRALREKDDIRAMAITTSTLHKDLKQDVFSADLAIIDVGGRNTEVFRSGIAAADFLIIPTLPSQYDIFATEDTVKLLKEARIYTDIPAMLLLNQVIPSTNIAREALAALEGFTDTVQMMDVRLHSRVAYKESVGRGEGVIEYEPQGKAAMEVLTLWKEARTHLEI